MRAAVRAMNIDEGVKMTRLSVPRIALVLSLMVPVAGFCAGDDVSWIADKSGCKVANPFPQPGESVAWNGQCKNGVEIGRASCRERVSSEV